MLKIRHAFILPLIVALVLAIAPACKRSAVEEPNPFGPSSHYLTLDISASPNVVLTSDIHEPVEIRALVKQGGQPAPNQLVVFTVLDGPGEFHNYLRRVAVSTNQNGYALATYLAPLRSEIGFDQTVVLYVHLQTSSPDFMWKTLEIRLLKG